MGFWKKRFGRRKKEQAQEQYDWEEVVYDRAEVNFEDGEQRSRYVMNCLEQIAEAAGEVKLLTGEYALVTANLTDMEEIEALPTEEREGIEDIARRLIALEKECEHYRDKKDRMSDSDYLQIREQESEICEGITKLRECEHYGGLVRQDLKRLDRERHAYEYRRNELEVMMNNFRGMAVIFFTAFALCMLLLVVLRFGFEMDTRIGWLLAAGAVAVAVTMLLVKYTDSEKELHRVGGAINRLIQLQNKVKIRYVNNNQLQDYLRMKYNAENADTLQKRWEQYLQEREERKEFAEAEAKTEYYRKQLVTRLNNYHISDSQRWTVRSGAFLDKREMVELRHELILQRQALRKQLDYNNHVAETARKEIMDIVKQYPTYAEEILAMVEECENKLRS